MSTDNKQDSEDRGTIEKRVHTRHDCHEPTFFSTKDGLYEGIIRDPQTHGEVLLHQEDGKSFLLESDDDESDIVDHQGGKPF